MVCYKRRVKLFVNKKNVFIPEEFIYYMQGYNKVCSQDILFIAVLLIAKVIERLFEFKINLKMRS